MRLLALLLSISLCGCGFELRGTHSIPSAFRTVAISPEQPFDPFQKALRSQLKAHQVHITTPTKGVPLILITQQELSERALSYQLDGQANRSILTLTITYQLDTVEHRLFVERELPISPNEFLATRHERKRIERDIYTQAATQLIRQLSAQRADECQSP